MLHVESRYVNLLSYRLDGFRQTDRYVWNARCPVCGDSARKKRKKRLYIYEREGRLLAFCHNCGLSMRFSRFLREVDPTLYMEFAREEWLERDTQEYVEKKGEHEPFKVDMSALDQPQHDPDDLPADHPAARFVIERLIPSRRMYYVDDFYGFARECVGASDDNPWSDRKEARMVIPFADRDGTIVGFQGRALDPDHPAKYITIRVDKTRPFLYGLDKLSEGDVYVLEGPIDAMMIPNAVASGGGEITRELELARIVDPIVVYDNERRNEHTFKKMRRAAERGMRVCVWPESLRHKDLNDMRRAGMSPDEVVRIIRESTHRGEAALAALALWEVA